MSVTRLRPKPATSAAQASPDLNDLENQICDVDRAARIAFLMMMSDAEHTGDADYEPLGLFAVEQVEQLASELRAAFYEKGARS